MFSSARATLIGALALLLWGTLAILTLWSGAVPPFQLVAMAFSLGFLIALVNWLVRGQAIWPRLKQPVGAWLLGVAGLFGYHFFYFLALRLAPPLEANLLNYLWPLLIVLFAALLPGEVLRPRHLLGALAGLAGAALLIVKSGGVRFEGRYALGYGAALACGVIWAGYSVLNRRYREVPSDAVGGFCAATALLALACHLAFEKTVWPEGWQWAAVLAMGLGPVGAAFFVWDLGCKHGNLRALGAMAYGVPLLSNGLLIAFGRGVLSWRVAAAAALIIGGAALGAGDLVRRRRRTGGESGPPAAA
ncbi:aromatic amino acid exporter YddG [mine drainage metagenome]|uniref:Aromatic amino acid exporter YddG n=1 Tax=mine drainage metagenome TaxID=410659 RepID=A0A1J5T276_9ZZZZ